MWTGKLRISHERVLIYKYSPNDIVLVSHQLLICHSLNICTRSSLREIPRLTRSADSGKSEEEKRRVDVGRT